MLASQNLSPQQLAAAQLEDQIADKVVLALRKSGCGYFHNLVVCVDGHTVSLQGLLPSYYLKRRAYQVVVAVPGVEKLIDDIELVR